MTEPVEAPRRGDLDDHPVEVEYGDEPWVTTVTARANDGSEVIVSWDEQTRTVGVEWRQEQRQRAFISHETLSKLSVRSEQGVVEFWIWYGVPRLSGRLVITVGDQVDVASVVLQT